MRILAFVILVVIFALSSKAVHSEPKSEPLTLSLQDAINLALENNPLIPKKKQQISIAQAEIAIKRGEFFPKVALKADYNKWGANRPKGSYSSYDAGITLTQPIYKGGSTTTQLKESQAKLAKVQAEMEEERQGLILEVTKGYYDILKAKELIKIEEEAIGQTKEVLSFVEAKFKAGRILKSELLISEIELLNNTQKLIRARNAYHLAVANFNNLLGRERTTVLKLSDNLFFDKVEIYPEEDLLEEGHKNQPKLHEVKSDITIAQMQLEKAKANYFKPDLDLVGEYKKMNNNMDYFYNNYNDIWFVGVSAKLPLFEGGSNKARIDKAESELEEVRIEEERVKQKVGLEIEEAYLRLKEKKEIVPLSIEATGKAEDNLRIFKERYKLGEINTKEFFEAQNLLISIQIECINALYDYNIARVELDKTTGLLERR